jgi:hypothetical protein
VKGYELRENAYFARKLYRSGIWTFGGIALGLLGLWLVYQVTIWSQFFGALRTSTWGLLALDLLVEVGVILTVVWLLYFSFVKLGLGPVSLESDDSGLHFHFQHRRDFGVRWADPRLKLVIRDSRSHPRAPPQTSLRLEFPWRAQPYVYLTEPAWQGILVSARSAGMRVIEAAQKEFPDYARKVEYYVIQAPAT